MEELFDTEGIDIDMSEEVFEEVPEETTEDVSEESSPDQVTDQQQNEQIEETPEDEKIENALKKILTEIGDKKEEDSSEDISEDSSEDISEELPEEGSEVPEVETSSVMDYSPYLTDILKEIKDSDSSKEVSQMYQAVTSVTDSNVLTGTLNEQSATNVILLAIFTVLLVDTAIHFIKGVL